jgi:hypothetical protein
MTRILPLALLITLYTLPALTFGASNSCEARPTIMPCYNTAVSNMPNYRSDDLAEMQQLLKACRGNYGDSCLIYSLNQLSSYEYDDLSEMVTLIKSCRGVTEVECVELLCEKSGGFRCDDVKELAQINLSCAAAMPRM